MIELRPNDKKAFIYRGSTLLGKAATWDAARFQTKTFEPKDDKSKHNRRWRRMMKRPRWGPSPMLVFFRAYWIKQAMERLIMQSWRY